MNGRSSRVFIAAAVVATIGLAGAGIRADAPPKPKPKAERKEEPPKKRRRVVSNLSGFELLDQARLKDKPMVAGATRVLGAKPPVILAPRLGKLYGTSPVFAWRHEGKRFAFVLWDEAGTELHAAEVEGQSYAWPSGAPRLADGQTYLWSVKAAESAAEPGATAGVVVVTPAERGEIDRALLAAKDDEDPYRAALARAQAFVDQRVWYDALAVYADLIERLPDRAEAFERRGMLYTQIPALASQADEEFARADALTSSRR
jgi:hypothetical protein